MKPLNNIKETGFKTPKDYFNSLEAEVMSKINLENALADQKNAGFKLPDNYMDSLEDAIINKLPEEKPKVITLSNRMWYLSGIAAAILIAFGIFNTSLFPVNEELDAETVESYILENSIDTYELAALLTEEEITTIDNEIFTETFSEESIEDYLIENADIEDILEQ